MTDEKTKNSDEARTKKAGGYRGQRGADRVVNRVVEILPHPEVLESYNYVVEGSADVIIDMFEREQKHRHEWEMQSLRFHNFATVLGQILGFFVAVAAFASATMIGVYGSATIATFIWVFAMAMVVMAGLIWAYARNMGQRVLLDNSKIQAAPPVESQQG